jgi:hypothetical protein
MPKSKTSLLRKDVNGMLSSPVITTRNDPMDTG